VPGKNLPKASTICITKSRGRGVKRTDKSEITQLLPTKYKEIIVSERSDSSNAISDYLDCYTMLNESIF
jgi:hypothetical protein